jgi:hypothetical protein
MKNRSDRRDGIIFLIVSSIIALFYILLPFIDSTFPNEIEVKLLWIGGGVIIYAIVFLIICVRFFGNNSPESGSSNRQVPNNNDDHRWTVHTKEEIWEAHRNGMSIKEWDEKKKKEQQEADDYANWAVKRDKEYRDDEYW